MAKSSRASVNKRNRTNLRKRVFGPADLARAERLSTKLQELAAQPKPQRDAEMELDRKSNTHIGRLLIIVFLT